jgi:hypothetical protein
VLGRKIDRKRRERAIVKMLAEHGAVFYDYQSDENGRLIDKAEAPGPKWLRDILGDDFFGEVTVFFSEDSREGFDLPKLKEVLEALPYLKKVEMCTFDFKDADLACFEGLTQIETLSLMASINTSEAGLKHFKRLTALKYLIVHGRFSDGDVSDLLKALPTCEIEMCLASACDH